MQKFKQAIPLREQTPGFETDVVGRAFMFARDAGLNPVTAWLQFESNAARTMVSVVVDCSQKKAIKRLLKIPKQKATEKLWSKALPFVQSDIEDIGVTITFGLTHSALVIKRNPKESVVIFRTFCHA
jgi:hypothetical protein